MGFKLTVVYNQATICLLLSKHKKNIRLFQDFQGGLIHQMYLFLLYPLVNIQKAIENGPLIVDLPINSMVMFHSYVSLPEGTFLNMYDSSGPHR